MAITKASKPLGKYGRMRKTYLLEHHKLLYSRMLRDGSLWQHLRDIDEQAQSMVNAIVSRMAEIDDVTEELKATDPISVLILAGKLFGHLFNQRLLII